MVSPQVGLAFKLTGDGKTVFKAHWGRYYRGIITGEFDDLSPATSPGYVFDGSYDDTGPPQNAELAERQFLLTTPSEVFTKYDGLSVQLVKRMADHWQMTASLVLSKSTGRLGSSTLGPTDRQSALASSFGQNPNDYVNTDGRLIEDRPVVFKTQFVYELPKGFLVGLNFNHQSGRPYAVQAIASDEVGIPGTRVLAEKIDGSRRVSSSNVLDLRLQKDFKLSSKASLALFLDALNALNADASEGVGDRLGSSENFGLPTDFIFPRRLMVGAKLHF